MGTNESKFTKELKTRDSEIQELRQTLEDRESQTKDISSKYGQLSKLEAKKT